MAKHLFTSQITWLYLLLVRLRVTKQWANQWTGGKRDSLRDLEWPLGRRIPLGGDKINPPIRFSPDWAALIVFILPALQLKLLLLERIRYPKDENRLVCSIPPLPVGR